MSGTRTPVSNGGNQPMTGGTHPAATRPHRGQPRRWTGLRLAAVGALAVGMAVQASVGAGAASPRTMSTHRAVALTGSGVPPTYTWPKFGHDAGNTGLSADPTITNTNAGTLGVRWMSGTGAAVVSSPVGAWSSSLSKTLVLVANNAGYLTAFDQATGAFVWSDRLGSQIVSTPLVEGNFVWVSAQFSPVLEKIDVGTGAVRCSAPLTSTIQGSPTIGTPAGKSTSIYIAANDLGASSGPIYSIDEATCAANWTSTAYNSDTGSWDPLSFATDANGRSLLLLGTSDPDNSIYAFDASTGARVWSFNFPPQPGTNETDLDVGAGVTVSPPGANGFADGVAYLPDEDGYLFAFDLTTGAVVWNTYFGAGLPPYHVARATPALIGGNVVFGEGSGVMAYNAVTGTRAWAYDTGGVESISAPAGLGPAGHQVVAITTTSGAFEVLDAATGAPLYAYQTPNFIASSLADVDGNLIGASADGFVYDMALGGGNGAAPTTAINAPMATGSVANPGGSLTVKGIARGTRVTGVQVAVQSGGTSGPWWNSQTGTWTSGYASGAAVLPTAGLASANWTFSFPVPPAGGSYRVLASAVQANGIADVTELTPAPGKSDITFTVAAAAGTPKANLNDTWVAPGGTLQLTATGFLASEPVTVSLAGTTLLTRAATMTGAVYKAKLTIPTTAVFGPTSATVTGQTSGRSASIPINISNSWIGEGNGPAHLGFEPNDQVLLVTVAPGPPGFLNPVWTDPIGANVRTSAAVDRGIAYFGDSAGGVHALDIHNGAPVWTVTESSGVDSSPALDGPLLVFGTAGGSVMAVNRSNGSTAWSTATSSAVRSAPAVSNNNVYIGSADGTVYDLNSATGTVVWTTKLAGAVTGSPAVDPTTGIVVVGDASGAVSGMSVTTGAVTWTHLTGGPVTASASLSGGTAYLGSGDGTVYAFTESTGTVRWSMATGSPVTASGTFYDKAGSLSYYAVGSQDGTVRLYTLTTGSLVVAKEGAGPVVGMAASTGWIVVTCANGQIWGFKRKAEPIWKLTAPAAIATAPIVVDGVVYIGGDSQTFTAYTVPGGPIP